MELKLERRDQQNRTPVLTNGVSTVMITPQLGEDYWAYRVQLTDRQAVLGFPKFGTIGVGFAVEEDWNTNFPYTCGTEEIFNHIAHNKGDDSIPDESVRAAIALIQEAARADRDGAK